MGTLKDLENIYTKQYGIEGIYTKPMEAEMMIEEKYGVVERLQNARINAGGVEQRMVIKTPEGKEISCHNEKGFNVGDEVVCVSYLSNKPATGKQISRFEEIDRIVGIKFVPDYKYVIYGAREYEQMKNNGGPKRNKKL